MGQVLITKSILTAIANAIRGKNGSSDTYKPGEMAAAITALPSAGTMIEKSISANGTYKAEDDDADGYSKVVVSVGGPTLITKNITQNGTYNASGDSADGYSSVTVDVTGYQNDDFADRTKPAGVVNVPSDVTEGSGNLKWQYLLSCRSNITQVNLPYTTVMPTGFCQRCTSLAKVVAPLVRTMFGSAFNGCTSLVNAVFPALKSFESTSAFGGCTSLVAADFGGDANTGSRDGFYAAYTFSGSTNMGILVLRGPHVWKLSNVNTFNGTKFASGNAGGTLYVPNDLIASYQANTNWATVLGYGSGAQNSIKSIESTHTDPTAPVDLTTHYIDGTLIPTT